MRLHQGRFDRISVYPVDPEEAARKYFSAGIKRIHLVILWGAREGIIAPSEQHTIGNIIRLRNTLTGEACQIQLGGGIRQESQIRYFFNQGVDYLIVGTCFILPLALEAGFTQGDLKRFYQKGGKSLELEREVPEFDLMERLDKTSRDRIIVAIDYRGQEVGLSGWEVTLPLLPEYCIKTLILRGYRNFLLTNIERDGTLKGVDTETLQRLLEKVKNLPGSPNILIAGGISCLEDVEALSRLPCPPQGVVIGKALYQKRLALSQLLARFPQT